TVESVIQSATATAGVTKSGTGSLVLIGNNTYTGDTIIQAGTLDLRGSIAGSLNILLKPDALLNVANATGGFRLALTQTLKGTGTVTGNSTIDGVLSPGEGLGTLQFTGNLTLAGTASHELQKTGFSLNSDLANVSGLLTLGGALNVTASGDLLAMGDTFNLFDAGSFAGTFTSYNLPALDPGLFWDTSKLGIDGTLAVVPEPSAALLLTCAAALLGMRRRRASIR
ncbi:MAG: PEP-CTERM sorting domain-containing protein, partial [Verrucomicrobiaceae bacterium]